MAVQQGMGPGDWLGRLMIPLDWLLVEAEAGEEMDATNDDDGTPTSARAGSRWSENPKKEIPHVSSPTVVKRS